MTWILMASLVGVVVLSVRDQLQREHDAYCMSSLAREYSLENDTCIPRREVLRGLFLA